MKYKSIEKASSKLMDGGVPTAYDQVLFRPSTPAVWGDAIYRFALGHFSVQNRSGSTAVVGIGVRLHQTRWVAGQWVDATTTFTDDTIDAQDVGASDFPLETLTSNDGFCVFARDQFSAICLKIGTASVGTNPTRVIEYTLAGGTWSAALTNMLVPAVTGAHFATGEALIWLTPPADWAVAEAAHGTGVPVGMYGLRMRSTTAAGTTAAVATSMSIAQVLNGREAVADNGIYSSPDTCDEHIFSAFGDSVVGLISVANPQNIFNMNVRVIG